MRNIPPLSELKRIEHVVMIFSISIIIVSCGFQTCYFLKQQNQYTRMLMLALFIAITQFVTCRYCFGALDRTSRYDNVLNFDVLFLSRLVR